MREAQILKASTNAAFPESKSSWMLKAICFLFFINLIIPVLDFSYNILGIDLEIIKKALFLSILGLSFLFHLNNKILISFESGLFCLFFPIAAFLGIYFNGLSSYIDLHIFAVVIPVMMISFGRHFYRLLNDQLIKFLFKLLNMAFYINLLLLILYIIFHHILDMWGYYGFGASTAFISAYLLSQRQFARFFLSFVLDIFSGKRTSLVVIISLYLIYSGNFSKFNIRTFLFSILFISSLSFIISNLGEYDFFRRLLLVTEIEFDDAVSVMMATGGRATEVISIIEYFDGDLIKWLLGSGLGSSYEYVDPRLGFSVERMHYAHFSPFSYILVFGSVFTFLLYSSFFYRLIKGFRHRTNFFYLIFLAFFLLSFFGSILFVQPIPWFFFGIMIEFLRDTKQQSSL